MNYIHLNTFKLMIYKNIKFEKISKSEQQLQSLSLIGINYDKRLKKCYWKSIRNPQKLMMLCSINLRKSLVLTFQLNTKNFY